VSAARLRVAGSRFGYAGAAAAGLAAAAAFVALAARRLPREASLLSPANLLTLGRAGAAALLCGSAFSGRGRRVSWLALLLGCTAGDWLDGPLARRHGATVLGGVLDLEADSWLTLWAAVAAYRAGRLPGWAMLAPAVRYPLLLVRRPAVASAPWQRTAGVAQMAGLCAALSPWPRLARAAPALAAPAAAAQLMALVIGSEDAKAAG